VTDASKRAIRSTRAIHCKVGCVLHRECFMHKTKNRGIMYAPTCIIDGCGGGGNKGGAHMGGKFNTYSHARTLARTLVCACE